MCTDKGGKNGSNIFGEGWGTFPPTPPQGRIWGDLGGRRPAAALDELWAGRREGKKGRVGGRRPARAQDIGLVAPARMARQGGPRHRRRGTGSGRQRGHTVAPHALARPNGLRAANKNQYGLNLKNY